MSRGSGAPYDMCLARRPRSILYACGSCCMRLPCVCLSEKPRHVSTMPCAPIPPDPSQGKEDATSNSPSDLCRAAVGVPFRYVAINVNGKADGCSVRGSTRLPRVVQVGQKTCWLKKEKNNRVHTSTSAAVGPVTACVAPARPASTHVARSLHTSYTRSPGTTAPAPRPAPRHLPRPLASDGTTKTPGPAVAQQTAAAAEE